MKKYFISYFTTDGDDDEVTVKADNQQEAIKLLKANDSAICEIQSIEEV